MLVATRYFCGGSAKFDESDEAIPSSFKPGAG